MNLNSLRRPDPRYSAPLKRKAHKSWAKSAEYRAHELFGLRKLDARSPQQVEADCFGAFYPWIIAARAEAQHVQHVGKAQATMRWRKAHSL